jgi:hypothetical protein
MEDPKIGDVAPKNDQLSPKVIVEGLMNPENHMDVFSLPKNEWASELGTILSKGIADHLDVNGNSTKEEKLARIDEFIDEIVNYNLDHENPGPGYDQALSLARGAALVVMRNLLEEVL